MSDDSQLLWQVGLMVGLSLAILALLADRFFCWLARWWERRREARRAS